MLSIHWWRITRLTTSTPGARSPSTISRSASLSEIRQAHLTHGNLLYTAWAFSLVTTIAPEEALLRGFSRFLLGWWPVDGS